MRAPKNAVAAKDTSFSAMAMARSIVPAAAAAVGISAQVSGEMWMSESESGSAGFRARQPLSQDRLGSA